MAEICAGVVSITLDAEIIEVEGEVKVQPLSRTQEMKVGIKGPVGWMVKGAKPYISVKAATLPGVMVKRIASVKDAVAQASLANGRQYVLQGAGHEGEAEIDADDGSVTFMFVGLHCDEL